ncbi:hypothetical protein BASA81_004071 [Batrachochytrium salamandrivorans]|nr:hypothetical protein BASA81_004071 [Batrachochytrium salamandrivorans]
MIPLERTMSGVFHDTNRLTPGQELRSIPSRMSMDERREFHQTHEPDWVLKGSSPKGSSAVVQALKYASKGFALSFAGRAAWTLLFSYLLSKSKAKPSLRASLADTLQFAGFFSGYTAVLHGVNALLVNARGVGRSLERGRERVSGRTRFAAGSGRGAPPHHRHLRGRARHERAGQGTGTRARSARHPAI